METNSLNKTIRGLWIGLLALPFLWSAAANAQGRGGPTVTADSVSVRLVSVESATRNDGRAVTISRMTVTAEANSKDISHIVFSAPTDDSGMAVAIDLASTQSLNPTHAIELVNRDPSIAKLGLDASGVKFDDPGFNAGTVTSIAIVTFGDVGYQGGETVTFKSARFAFATAIERDFREVDLSARLEASSAVVRAGETVTYTGTAVNLGDEATISSTRLAISFAGTFQIDYMEARPSDGITTVTADGGEAVFDRPILPSDSVSFTIVGRWSPDSVGSNTVSFTVENADDVRIENDSSEIRMDVNPAEGLEAVIDVGSIPDLVIVGDRISIPGFITNNSGVDAGSVSVTYTVSPERAAIIESVTVVTADGEERSIAVNSHSVRVDLGTVTASSTVSATAHVRQVESGEVTYTAVVEASGYDRYVAETEWVAASEVDVTAVAVPKTVYESAELAEYTFQATNNRPIEIATDVVFHAEMAREEGSVTVDPVISVTVDGETRPITCRESVEGDEIRCESFTIAPSSTVSYTVTTDARLESGIERAELTWSNSVAGSVVSGTVEVRNQAELASSTVTAKADTVEERQRASVSVSLENDSDYTLTGDVVAFSVSAVDLVFTYAAVTDLATGTLTPCRDSVDGKSFLCEVPVKLNPRSVTFYQVDVAAEISDRAALEGSYTMTGGFRSNGVTAEGETVRITVTPGNEPPPDCLSCDPQDRLACSELDGSYSCEDLDGDGAFCCEAIR